MKRDLTQRQAEILNRIADGESNKTIARSLAVSPRTIKATIATICRKTGARNRTHAVALRLAAGQLD